jgi:hypothetical protein
VDGSDLSTVWCLGHRQEYTSLQPQIAIQRFSFTLFVVIIWESSALFADGV